MWTVTGRKPVPSPYWDHTYAIDHGKWESMRDGIDVRLHEACHLITPSNPSTILDLGGGPLIARANIALSRLTIIDFSQEACALARQFAPSAEVICVDVIAYLRGCHDKYDLTVAMGILDYLPAGSLTELFAKAPSRELLINSPVCEGYLHQYETRVVVYSRKDITEAAANNGWWRVRGYDQHEHEFALYRRL